MPYVVPLVIKSSGLRKARLTPCGNFEDKSMFAEGSLFAPGLGETAFKALLFFKTYYRLGSFSVDIKQCFLNNDWKDSLNPRKISMLLSEFISGTGKKEIAACMSEQYGLRSAPGEWSRQEDRFMIELGYKQSAIFRKVFMKFSPNGGLMIIGWQTDDGFCVHSLVEAGMLLKMQFLTALKAKWECTIKDKVDQYLGIDLIYNEDQSLSMLQSDMIIKVKEKCEFNDDVKAEYLSLPKGYSGLVSSQSPKIDPKKYQEILGQMAFLRYTRSESPAQSFLASKAHDPSEADLDALYHFARFIWTTRHVPLTFYPGPIDANIDVPMEFNAWSDAAESDHNIERRMHIAWIIKGGPRGHPGGGIVTKNKQQPGVVADSVPIGELHTQLQCSKDAVNLRHFGEELANRTEGNTILEDNTSYFSWTR